MLEFPYSKAHAKKVEDGMSVVTDTIGTQLEVTAELLSISKPKKLVHFIIVIVTKRVPLIPICYFSISFVIF